MKQIKEVVIVLLLAFLLAGIALAICHALHGEPITCRP